MTFVVTMVRLSFSLDLAILIVMMLLKINSDSDYEYGDDDVYANEMLMLLFSVIVTVSAVFLVQV